MSQQKELEGGSAQKQQKERAGSRVLYVASLIKVFRGGGIRNSAVGETGNRVEPDPDLGHRGL